MLLIDNHVSYCCFLNRFKHFLAFSGDLAKDLNIVIKASLKTDKLIYLVIPIILSGFVRRLLFPSLSYSELSYSLIIGRVVPGQSILELSCY